MSVPMDDALREESNTTQRLKASLWFSVGKIADQESLRLNINATPQFIGALTEMVWNQIENAAIDLESFARHAGRSTISSDDVLLVTRRNEALHDMIQDFIEKEKAGKTRLANGKGRGKK